MSFRRAIGLGIVFQLVSSQAGLAGFQDSHKFQDGNKLWTFCSSEEATFNEGFCFGYVVGIADAVDSDSSNPLCFSIPDEGTQGQIVDVVKLWLRNNPSKRHYVASLIVSAALRESFPCKN